MGKTVIFVFKFVGMSILLMMLLDLTLMLTDAFSTNNKIQTVTDMMQQDIARQNCLTTQAEGVFTTMLTDIDSRSNVFNDITIVNNGLFESVSAANVGNYGDLKHLEITAHVNPWVYGIRSQQVNTMVGRFVPNEGRGYQIRYRYDVPCLRYLK